jgi:hypothetical protein
VSLTERSRALPSPDAVFQIYKAEFDLAFQERTMFILTQHPHVGGRRSRRNHGLREIAGAELRRPKLTAGNVCG